MGGEKNDHIIPVLLWEFFQLSLDVFCESLRKHWVNYMSKYGLHGRSLKWNSCRMGDGLLLHVDSIGDLQYCRKLHPKGENLRENQDTAGCRQNFPHTIRGEFMISMYRAEILMKAYLNKICHKALWAVRGRPERELRLTATLCIIL